jgi:O-antigen ligase
MPGRALYAAANAQLPTGTAADWKATTIVPHATAAAGLALLLPIAVFVGVRTLDPPALLTLVKLLLLVAVLQAILGLVQYGTAQSGHVMFAVEGATANSGTGTYANRNHLAGLIEMMLPVALALLFFSLGRSNPSMRRASAWRRKAAFLSSPGGRAAAVYAIVSFLLIIGIIFTRSRTGIFLGILGIILSALVFSRRIGGSNVFGPAGTLLALAVSFGIAIGLAPVLNRFSVDTLGDEGRWPLFALVLEGVRQFFPLGTGPATFPAVFPTFQSIEFGNTFVNRAHNDYLEWSFDAGILGLALIALVLVLYLRQWVRLRTSDEWTRSRFLQVAAGIGLLLLALHEFLDYNLYTPANQLVFAVLAGIFFMPVEKLRAADSQRRRKRNTPYLESPPMPSPTRTAQVAPDQIENPFRVKPPAVNHDPESK